MYQVVCDQEPHWFVGYSTNVKSLMSSIASSIRYSMQVINLHNENCCYVNRSQVQGCHVVYCTRNTCQIRMTEHYLVIGCHHLQMLMTFGLMLKTYTTYRGFSRRHLLVYSENNSSQIVS